MRVFHPRLAMSVQHSILVWPFRKRATTRWRSSLSNRLMSMSHESIWFSSRNLYTNSTVLVRCEKIMHVRDLASSLRTISSSRGKRFSPFVRMNLCGTWSRSLLTWLVAILVSWVSQSIRFSRMLFIERGIVAETNWSCVLGSLSFWSSSMLSSIFGSTSYSSELAIGASIKMFY